jgi:hypothetical protein
MFEMFFCEYLVLSCLSLSENRSVVFGTEDTWQIKKELESSPAVGIVRV